MLSLLLSDSENGFQSTLPRGSDIVMSEKELTDLIISIHAPSRERPPSASSLPLPADFNPRSLAGATITLRQAKTGAENFNPRSLAGATIKIQKKLKLIIFQSTLPRGSDQSLYFLKIWLLAISIHAPSRERLKLFQYAQSSEQISIHAPSRERPEKNTLI